MLDANSNDERDCVPDIHAAAGADAAGALVLAAPRSGIGQARPFKQCIYCKQTKPAAEFHRHAYTTKTGKRSERFNSSCKQCHGERTAKRKQSGSYRQQQGEYRARTRERRSAQGAAYRQRVTPEQKFRWYIGSRYKMTVEQYHEILKAQGGVCRACGRPPQKVGVKARLHVDHDHATGTVRGLLCHQCNVVLGLVRDDTEVLAALIGYLRESRV